MTPKHSMRSMPSMLLDRLSMCTRQHPLTWLVCHTLTALLLHLLANCRLRSMRTYRSHSLLQTVSALHAASLCSLEGLGGQHEAIVTICHFLYSPGVYQHAAAEHMRE